MDASMPRRTRPWLWVTEMLFDFKMRSADIALVFVCDHRSPLDYRFYHKP
jgi:hypothetical protein